MENCYQYKHIKIDLAIDKSNPDDVKFTTLESLSFEFNGHIYVIPSGFVSDGCSCPKFLWSIISPKIHPSTIIESIVHDYMFRKGMGFLASNIWYFAKLINNVGLMKAGLAFLGLSLFGWIAYLKRKAALQR